MALKIINLAHHINDGENRRTLFADLCLSVQQGECIALMGDSGSGKTTLLNLISGLEPIQQGEIEVADMALSEAQESEQSSLRKNHIGIIFQQFNLLASLSVRENIDFSAQLSGQIDENRGENLATALGIIHLLDKMPGTLSGGEMQRVAIARALNAKPKLLLADEPTGNLDKTNSEHVVEQLVKLVKERNTALLMVTHSLHVAKKMDRIYLLADGQITPYME